MTEDVATGGQIWTRLYARREGFPQVDPFLETLRRADRPRGICRLRRRHGAARSHVATGALVFRSAGYFLQLGRSALPLPAWLTPGELTVTHAELGDGRFRFTLEIVHPRFGLLIRQTAVFEEAQS